MQTKEELNLADTIKGEINRMCVTNDIAELDTMALHARRNIERLQSLRYASIIADTPQTDDKDEPQKDCKKCKNYDRCKNNRWKCCVYEPKDEPQTDCGWK